MESVDQDQHNLFSSLMQEVFLIVSQQGVNHFFLSSYLITQSHHQACCWCLHMMLLPKGILWNRFVDNGGCHNSILTFYFSKYFQNTKNKKYICIIVSIFSIVLKGFKFQKKNSTRLAFNASFSKSLIFFLKLALMLPFKRIKIKKYLDKRTKMKRKKTKD